MNITPSGRLAFGLVAILAASAGGQTVELHHVDATVWLHEQVIAGSVDSLFAASGSLSVNGIDHPFTISDSLQFSVPITLGNGESKIVAVVTSKGGPVLSDTLRLTMAYSLRPEILAEPTVNSRTVTLHGSITKNPFGRALIIDWLADPVNPAPVTVSTIDDSTATVEFPIKVSPGEYYFDAIATSAEGDTSRARTFVTVTDTGIQPFNLKTDHSRWIDDAVVYELSPSFFVPRGTYRAIGDKLQELRDLGISAVWLQPVTMTNEPCQGYHVTDYFRLRPDLGSEADLRDLVSQAHGLGLKVIFDIVPNHTSLYHPWALDARQHGDRSHYFDFYQRAIDTSKYAWTEFLRRDGEMDFVYYFWYALVNLNFQSPEVQEMMIRAGREWIERFDIDGYRVDAVWGVDTRAPEYMKRWRAELKRIKPEIFLLGETKAPWWSSFDERYDAAFDWSSDDWYISLWSWAVGVGSTQVSLFQREKTMRTQLLRTALTNNGRGFHPRAKILRYMENNDTHRFLFLHGHAQTRMAAGLMFALPGIPMLYNGQEVGQTVHPYDCTPIYNASLPIRSQDPYGFFSFYQRLALTRQRFDALRSDLWEEIPIMADGYHGENPLPGAFTFSFRRWTAGQEMIVAANLSDTAVDARMRIPVGTMAMPSDATSYLTDVLTGEVFPVRPADLDTFALSLPPYTTRILLLADSAYVIPTSVAATVSVPATVELSQNFPNPFNAQTVVRYSLPKESFVDLRVFDLLGREVAVIVRGLEAAGPHEATVNAGSLSSGIYLVRLQSGTSVATRRMVLLK